MGLTQDKHRMIPETMNLRAFLSLVVVASTQAFAPIGGKNYDSKVSTLRAEIGDSGVSFEHVAREWRCKVCHAISRCFWCRDFLGQSWKGSNEWDINCILP